MEKRYMDSPMDLLRNGRLLRAKDFGLTPTANSSLEINQSFPRLSRKLKAVSRVQLSKVLLNPEDMNSVSFSTQATQSSYQQENQTNLEDSLNLSCLNEDTLFNPNPHKGVLTIDIKTSQIMITNTTACKMLGYSSTELLETKFRDLVIREKSQLALADMIFNEKGEIVVFNGKVIEMQCKDGSKIAVSCWLTNTDDEGSLYVAVIEPVQRIVSYLLMDESGLIMAADETAFSLFHCSEERFVGQNINKWIPSIIWPNSLEDLDEKEKIQRTTGCNETKQNFPITLRLDHYEGDSVISLSETTSSLPCYSATLWVFTNMSGMLLITYEGLIIDCNSLFSRLALGYAREQLVGKELSDILLNFSNPQNGHYHSEVHHENGSFIPVSYFVNGPVEGVDVYQVWMAIASSTTNSKSILGASELSNTKNGTANRSERDATKLDSSEDQPESKESSIQKEDMYDGEYLEHYQTVKQIGTGGFGCVQLAYGVADNKLVVTKFIKKSKVYSDSWIETKDGHRLPYEIYFLKRIQHENIVRLINFYENETYFQLVMEKHGFGMDLFEFIEKTNGVPEPLGAYIAKQLVEAVEYLHSNCILHRDIKDENIVLDDQFHAKLIDFGSATHLTNKPFKAFCGTFEYCSPEVLKGNPYLGPELEVWAMGATIYVLVFGRNPFSGIEEILKNSLEFPDSASLALQDLLSGMMNRIVDDRFGVQDVLRNCWLNQAVFLDDYDFYDICDLNRSGVEFQNSRYIYDEGPVASLATSTPYRKRSALQTPDHSSFEINDESVHFQVPELVFNELSNHTD